MTRRWKGWLFGSVNTHTQRIMSTFTLKVFVDIMHINKRSKHARVIDEGVCVCLWDRAHVNQCGSLCVWYMGRYRVTASQQYPLFGANITYPSVSWSHTHTHRQIFKVCHCPSFLSTFHTTHSSSVHASWTNKHSKLPTVKMKNVLYEWEHWFIWELRTIWNLKH